MRNATVLNNGAIIRIRRERSTDGSDEECFTESSSEEENGENDKQDDEAEPIKEEAVAEKTPEPEGIYGLYIDYILYSIL